MFGLIAAEAENSVIRLGSRLPAFGYKDLNGGAASLITGTEKRMTAVALLSDPRTDCSAIHTLERTESRLSQFTIRIAVVARDVKGVDGCIAGSRALTILALSDRAAAQPTLGEGGGVIGLLLDEQGVVRLRTRASDVRGLARQLAEDIKAWHGGKQIYDAQCARCHGADGRDLSYPNVKSLAGIGNRHSKSEIIERTILTGAVDMSHMSESDKNQLALYVAGL
jgi:mono/diheme cytochrome c family protein